MGKIVEKKKKKKGRPSLLDLQKRNLKEQEEERQLQQKRRISHNSAPPPRDNNPSSNSTRRSARRNPNPGEDSPEEDDDEDEELAGKRREKKLKLVLRLPRNQKSSRDSGGSDSNAEEDDAAVSGGRKRKINAIDDGSGTKVEKSISGANQLNSFQGAAKLEPGPSTPLPDKKLLQFVLDRLQKKDTYGVFSDPVDPEELPDYHEVINDPMDFATVRQKLSGGAYASLEQFEKDVFLICSNAMQYNSPDTIYFRQARSIHELAKKNFDSLRHDSDNNNEPEFKIVRRGRPPTKILKKPVTEFSSDVTPTSAGENPSLLPKQDSRHGSLLLDKSGLADSSGRLQAVRSNYDLFSNFSADNRFERSDELTGSFMKGSVKNGKKQVAYEESRRVTYMQSCASASMRDPSVLATFDGERKQLMPVGVLVEHGYARSLARFAADLGSVAWKIASAKIEKSLPAGVNFGPGWVGENDLPQRKMPLILSQLSGKLSVSRNLPDLAHSHRTEKSCSPDSKLDKSPVKADSSDKHDPSSSTLSKSLPVSTDAVPLAGTSNRSPEPVRPSPETLKGSKSHSGVRPSPAHQGPAIHPSMNGFNLAAQMGNKGSHPRPNPSWQSMSQNPRPNQNSRPQHIPDSVPPDLNVRFQSPGSPTSSKVDSAQPDLALQL